MSASSLPNHLFTLSIFFCVRSDSPFLKRAAFSSSVRSYRILPPPHAHRRSRRVSCAWPTLRVLRWSGRGQAGRAAHERDTRSVVSCVWSSKTVVARLRSSRSAPKSNSLRIIGISCMFRSFWKVPCSTPRARRVRLATKGVVAGCAEPVAPAGPRPSACTT